MKTAEEILREIGHGVISKSVATEAMKEYAKEVAQEVLKLASENATPEYVDGRIVAVDKASILNTDYSNLFQQAS